MRVKPGGRKPSSELIETKRLILRPMRQSDNVDVLRILANREVTEHTALTRHQRIFIEQMQRHTIPEYHRSRHQERMQWAVTLPDDDTLIGRCGFEEIYRHIGYAELGYWLAREYWGQGLMSEAIAAVLDYGFRISGFQRIQAWVLQENRASIRVLEKNGFQAQPTDSLMPDLLPFCILKKDYETLRGAAQHGAK